MPTTKDGRVTEPAGHSALWLDSPGGALRTGSAPVPRAGPGEVVVRARAVALNPIDAMGRVARRVVLPWLRYPAVLGSDVAGEIVAVGPGVDGLKVTDRVAGYAVGVEKSRNSPAEGAFQTHVVLLQHMCATLPDTVSFEEAAVLPLALTTAASGLFDEDQLALDLPTATPPQRHETVLILGGATSVGMNAIQLARNAGYKVVATASTRNFPRLHGLGAGVVVDYHDSDAIEQIVHQLQGRQLVGTLAVASGTLRQALAVNSGNVTGTKRIACAQPTPDTKIRGVLARRRAIHVSTIWGGNPKDTAVGPAVWNTFLPAALTDHRYRAAPTPRVTGHGLDAIPDGLALLRKGVSAEKLVVTL